MMIEIVDGLLAVVVVVIIQTSVPKGLEGVNDKRTFREDVH